MNPLVLRAELPPDEAVVVVRGGEMNSAYVRASAQDAFADCGVFTISVSLALDLTVGELCASDRRISRYGKVRLSTVGRLRGEGFALLPTLARPHYDVVLADLSNDTLDRLESVFDAPIPRPHGGRVA